MDIQHLIRIRNDILEQINQIYQDEINSYGNSFEKFGEISSDI